MIEGAVKAFFFVGLLLLGAILVRRDLFLNPSERSNKQDIQPRMPKKEHCAPVCDFSKAEHLDLRGTTNVWNPLLLSFLVNDRPVNIALGSDEHLYVQLKAYEFCTENAILLNLRTLEKLEANCVRPVSSVLIEKIETGDFVRPITRGDGGIGESVESSEKMEGQMEGEGIQNTSNDAETEDTHQSISNREKTDSGEESSTSSEMSSVGDDAPEPALDVAEVNNS